MSIFVDSTPTLSSGFNNVYYQLTCQVDHPRHYLTLLTVAVELNIVFTRLSLDLAYLSNRLFSITFIFFRFQFIRVRVGLLTSHFDILSNSHVVFNATNATFVIRLVAGYNITNLVGEKSLISVWFVIANYFDIAVAFNNQLIFYFKFVLLITFGIRVVNLLFFIYFFIFLSLEIRGLVTLVGRRVYPIKVQFKFLVFKLLSSVFRYS